MNWDDVIYVLLLVATIVLSDVIRRLDSAKTKQSLSSLFGLAIVILVSGWATIHCLLEMAINGLIICFISPKYCHGVSFVFSFLYLLFFRSLVSLGLPAAPAHTNAVQMMLTLKLVGLALEVSETAKNKKKLKEGEGKDEDLTEAKLALEHRGVNVNFLDIFHYAFCHVGVLTGPYFKYRTYWDMLHANNCQTSFMQHALKRLKMLPLYAVLFVVSSYYFPLSYAKSEEIFTERSLLYRIWYMTPLFFTFRMRFYSGFILSEVACIAAGLGAYPAASAPKPGQGPTALDKLSSHKDVKELNFETVHNIDEYAAEFYDVRDSLKSWNMTVQWWLVVNVHRPFPFKPLRTVVTMLTSAFWHGVHSGYYLSMLTVPFILVAEDLAKRKFRNLVNPKVFDMVAGAAKIQWFSYMGVAFSLLAMDATMAYWRSIYFIGHVMIVLVYVVSRMAPSSSNRSAADVKSQ